MTATYDLSTPVGMVRLLIGDKDINSPIFTDEELTSLYGQNGSAYLTAAAALDIIAVNEAMVLKVIRVLDLSTDGPAVAAALREQARIYREQANTAVVAVDIAQMNLGSNAGYIWLRDELATEG